MGINDRSFNTPLSPIRFQSQLGKEVKRMYKEGSNIVKLSLARVTKVNYKYNTVEVITTLRKNTTMKNPSDNGKYSARLPVTFGGRTPDGKVYGTNTLVTVGSLVLIGFLEGNKDNPIVLNIYGEADNQSQLTRTTLTSADESDEAVQQELWQLFSLFPSMTYRNIDGRGNQEVTFSGKSFLYITDTDPENAYVQDEAFDYADLPNSRYANGELIEPASPNSPTLLYVHQGIYDKHRVTFFIKSDGTVRLGSRHLNGKGITFQELNTDGSMYFVQKRDTTNPEEESSAFSRIGITEDGKVILDSSKHSFEIRDEGVFVDGKPLASAIGGGGTGGIFDEILEELENVTTTITVMDGKIESKISKTVYEIDLQEVRDYAKGLSDGVMAEVAEVNKVVGDMDEYLDGAFRDGVIVDAESKAIASYINSLNKEKADVDAKYTEVAANTFLPTAKLSSLTAAKNAYNNKHAALITTIQVAIASNTITDEERTAVDTAFAEYSTAVATLTISFESAIDAIATAKAEKAKEDAMSHTDGEIQTISSTISQLAESITLKVDSETYTSDIQNLQATLATKEETAALSDRIDAAEQTAPYRVEVWSTDGLLFRTGSVTSTVYCKVFQGSTELTNTFGPNNFIWSRVSNDATADAAWNAAHTGVGSSFQITSVDVSGRATFECALDI